MTTLETAAPVDVRDTLYTPSLAGHVRIARFDHWVKNVFVLPGAVAAIALNPVPLAPSLITRLILGLIAIGLVASSNYTINELIDAPFDRNHPSKRLRPVPSGMVNVPLAYVQWIVLGVAGIAIAMGISRYFAYSVGALWFMGFVYNIPPVRTKDVPYLDVISEAVNNPIRMVSGWFLMTSLTFPPGSLLLSYWMVGCYFMAIKRFAEARQIGDRARAGEYRKSLAYFSPEGLLVAIVFYGSAAMLFFGAFIMRYRIELILSFPLVALVMAQYLALGFDPDSAAQNPEKLYRSSRLMASVICCTAAMALLLLVDLPIVHTIFDPNFVNARLH
jgi:4-hydroxybenzoate polyprenyltransferase